MESFFKSGHLLKEWNSTAISLIPKTSNPSRLEDFRPIACCGVLYKIISKLMAGKLKNVIEDLVSTNQSGFIPGRSITDRILVADDIVRNYHRDGISKRCTIKIDVRKAYDTMR